MGIEMALLAVSAMSAYKQGESQRKAYETQAKQAELQGEAQILDRTRALNEAMANQNAMMGASGRTLESATSVLKGDEKRYTQDTDLIRAGVDAQSSQYKMAGQAASSQENMDAASALGKGAYQYSMLGSKSKTSTSAKD